MRKLLLVLFLCPPMLVAESSTCQFQRDKSIYIFSGSMASVAYRLGLYKDSALKGILNTYNFSKSNIATFDGGIFLSQKSLDSISNDAIIFMDESRELEKTLEVVQKRKKSHWKILKVLTQDKSPALITHEALDLISPLLENSKACSTQKENIGKLISAYKKRVQEIELIPGSKLPRIYFFVGQWKNNFPQSDALILYQEGFLNDFIENKRMAPYDAIPETTRFSTWPAKVLKNKNAYFVSIDSQLEDKNQTGAWKKVSNNKFEVQCFACLIPGLFQLEWVAHL